MATDIPRDEILKEFCCELVYLICPKCKVGPIYAKEEIEMFGNRLPDCCRCNERTLSIRAKEKILKEFDNRENSF